ncbi:Coiled-coil protein [Entamoeba marina]
MTSPWIAAAVGTGIFLLVTICSTSFVFICRMKDKKLGFAAIITAGLTTWLLWFLTYISQMHPYGPPEVKVSE